MSTKLKLPNHLTRGGINHAGGQKHPDAFALQLCRMIISEYVTPRRHFDTKTTSYHMKHVFERLGGCYVGNGDFIAAMILEGYEWKQRRPGSPNAYFRADFRRVKALDRMIKKYGPPQVDPDCADCLSAQTAHYKKEPF